MFGKLTPFKPFGSAPQETKVVFVRDSVCDFISERNDEKKSIFITNPLQMLLDQQRLMRAYGTFISDWLGDGKANTAHSDLSDDDLVSILKSRYSQRPTEMKKYIEELSQIETELSSKAQEIINEYDKQVSEQKELEFKERLAANVPRETKSTTE